MKRFWSKVDIKNDDECWEWKAAKYGKYAGYGYFWLDDRMQRAHRVAYKLTYGDFDESKLICHKCDNPGCCNPKHLYIGDKGTNATDCKGKIGRLPRWYEGELWLIRHLHNKGIIQKDIGRMFRVNQSTISDILNDSNYPSKTINRYEKGLC